MAAPCSPYVPDFRFGFGKPPLTCGYVVGDTGIESVSLGNRPHWPDLLKCLVTSAYSSQ